MDLYTFYSLIEIAGISPLCQKLLQTDRYPALRLILAFKQAMCGVDNSPEYVKEGKFDENAFADSVIVSFPDMVKKLKVRPEKEEQFWNIFHLIVRKAFLFISTTELFSDEQKLDFFKPQYAAIKVSTFMAAAFGNENFNSLMTFLKEIISELENKINQTNIAAITRSNKDKPIQLKGKADDDIKVTSEKQSKSASKASGPKYLPFELLFNDQKMIEPLINYLKRDRIRILDDKSKWLGMTRKKTEAMGFIDALRKRTLINFTTAEEVGTAFKNKFEIDMDSRSFTLQTRTRNDFIATYLRIIDDFLSDYNKSKPPQITT